MSLVNDMLRDLEQRSARPREPLAGVRAPARTPAPKSTRPVVLAGLLVSVAAALLFGLEYRTPSAATPVRAAETARAPVTQPLPDEPAVATLASLQRYRLDYRLASKPATTAAAAVAPKVRTTAPAVEAPASRAVSVRTVVTEQPAPRARVTRTRVDPLVRLRRDGLSALQAGRAAEAERHFRELVALEPSPAESHLLLHRALVAQSRPGEARAVLSAALDVSAEPARIAFVLAHSLLQAGDSMAAQSLLERHRDAGGVDIDYVALLAAVYERNGDYERAADGYVYLVSQRPGHGAWWIGLAIATDALGRRSEARAAFERASRSRDLDPALARYATERLTRMDTAP